jgi:hypothetical protein
MILQIILYTATIFAFEWIALFAGVIPGLLLGLMNRFVVKGAFTPMHPIALVMNLIPSLLILFLFDLLWVALTKAHLPLVILPVLIVIHIRNLRDPDANFINQYQATETIVGCLIFGIFAIVRFGLDGVNWI